MLAAINATSNHRTSLFTESGRTKDAMPKQSDAINDSWRHGILKPPQRDRFHSRSSSSTDGSSDTFDDAKCCAGCKLEHSIVVFGIVISTGLCADKGAD